MTSLRLFVCQPYGARITPSACAQRYPRPVASRRSVGSGARVDRVHCHECPVGAAHARGEDAPGVEYSLVEVGALAPPREPVTRPVASSRGSDMASGMPTPQTGNALGSNAGSDDGVTARRDEHPTTTEDPMPATETPAPKRAAKKCARAGCDAWFTPTGPRGLYCEEHRTSPAQNQAAKERMRAMRERRKALEDVSTALDRAVEAATTEREEPSPEPTPSPTPAIYVGATAMVDADRWASRDELDEHERAAAEANDELVVDEKGCGWVSTRWLLGHRSRQLSRLRDVIERTKRVVGDAWTKDRPLDQAVEMKCRDITDQAGHKAFRASEAMRELRELKRERDDLRTSLAERGERIKVLQREIAERESGSSEAKPTLVEAFAEAFTPPPGVGAAAVLRAVGYQVVTVDSPRGPVIVVEGASRG
jgi:hypothetical protein